MPADDSPLEIGYTYGEIADVETNDGNRVSQDAAGEFAIHQFRDEVTGNSCDIAWDGQTNIAPSEFTEIGRAHV